MGIPKSYVGLNRPKTMSVIISMYIGLVTLFTVLDHLNHFDHLNILSSQYTFKFNSLVSQNVTNKLISVNCKLLITISSIICRIYETLNIYLHVPCLNGEKITTVMNFVMILYHQVDRHFMSFHTLEVHYFTNMKMSLKQAYCSWLSF